MNKKFGDLIHEVRKSKKLTLDKLVEISNVSITTLSNLEKGKKVNLNTVAKLANALELDFDELYEVYKNDIN